MMKSNPIDANKEVLTMFKPHPIQRTKKETIVSIYRKVNNKNKQNTKKGYVK